MEIYKFSWKVILCKHMHLKKETGKINYEGSNDKCSDLILGTLKLDLSGGGDRWRIWEV
jgi:hypothetical protein